MSPLVLVNIFQVLVNKWSQQGPGGQLQSMALGQLVKSFEKYSTVCTRKYSVYLQVQCVPASTVRTCKYSVYLQVQSQAAKYSASIRNRV